VYIHRLAVSILSHLPSTNHPLINLYIAYFLAVTNNPYHTLNVDPPHLDARRVPLALHVGMGSSRSVTPSPTCLATRCTNASGHEIVATIAQIHLHPSVQKKLCTILPPEAKCHLAPVAAWADQVRGRFPGTGGMHYVNGTSALSARAQNPC
jgi:hypothetical protein